jgi:signal recognition particle receptor subunit beta
VAVHPRKQDVIEFPIRCIIKAGEGIYVFDLPGQAAFAR